MKTKSLLRRSVAAGTATVAVTALVASLLVFMGVRAALLNDLNALLHERAVVVLELAGSTPPEELASLLGRMGIRARVRPAGDSPIEVVPAVPRTFDRLPAVGETALASPSRLIPLPDGGDVEVRVSRTGVDRALSQLATILLVVGVAATAIAASILTVISRRVLAPLDEVVATAGEIARGDTTLRLRPDSDRTEIGRLAAAFDEMLEALTRALDQQRAAEERSRRFLADAAHQLRRPAAALELASTALATADVADTAQERARLLRVIGNDSHRVACLVSELLILARLDMNERRDWSSVDFGRLVATLVEEFTDGAPHLRFDSALTSQALELTADVGALREAVTNLLDNATRHAVSLVEVHLAADRKQIALAVRDDGPGPDAQQLPRLFARFASFDNMGGAGLGLAIVRAAARAHGGDATYRDGAFKLTLPQHGVDREASGRHLSQLPESLQKPSGNRQDFGSRPSGSAVNVCRVRATQTEGSERKVAMMTMATLERDRLTNTLGLVTLLAVLAVVGVFVTPAHAYTCTPTARTPVDTGSLIEGGADADCGGSGELHTLTGELWEDRTGVPDDTVAADSVSSSASNFGVAVSGCNIGVGDYYSKGHIDGFTDRSTTRYLDC